MLVLQKQIFLLQKCVSHGKIALAPCRVRPQQRSEATSRSAVAAWSRAVLVQWFGCGHKQVHGRKCLEKPFPVLWEVKVWGEIAHAETSRRCPLCWAGGWLSGGKSC